MRPPVIRYIVYFVLCTLFDSNIQAQTAEDSFVAIALANNLCDNSDGGFISLPEHDSDEANIDYLSLIIDLEFGENCKLNGLLIGGKISIKTLPQLNVGLELLEKRRNDSLVTGNRLWLDSPGGLISEAMKIGDLIARKEMEAIIPFNGQCLSSCVLIFAAAKTRSRIGDIGIHRPFSNEISTNSLRHL